MSGIKKATKRYQKSHFGGKIGIKKATKRYQKGQSEMLDGPIPARNCRMSQMGDRYGVSKCDDLSPVFLNGYADFRFFVTDVTDDFPIGEKSSGSFDTGLKRSTRVNKGKTYLSHLSPQARKSHD